jgi:hypothetical protein
MLSEGEGQTVLLRGAYTDESGAFEGELYCAAPLNAKPPLAFIVRRK